jgi:cystathionine gamma-synthase
MSTITVMSKQPPGGRCSLYMRYAEALRDRLGLEVEILYCEGGAGVPPPAILIGEAQVVPADGVIVAPEDFAASLRGHLSEPEIKELVRVLEATQERWMEEWSNR